MEISTKIRLLKWFYAINWYCKEKDIIVVLTQNKDHYKVHGPQDEFEFLEENSDLSLVANHCEAMANGIVYYLFQAFTNYRSTQYSLRMLLDYAAKHVDG